MRFSDIHMIMIGEEGEYGRRLVRYLETHLSTAIRVYHFTTTESFLAFKERDIPVEAGTLNVHFWQYGKDFRFLVASEIQAPAEETVRRPKMKLLGHDGNIFSIMGDARRLLVRNGQSKEADEMFQRVQDSGNYYQALGIISEYVETELSVPKQEKEKPHRKPEKGGTSR